MWLGGDCRGALEALGTLLKDGSSERGEREARADEICLVVCASDAPCAARGGRRAGAGSRFVAVIP